jgi:hypothetical protein
MYTNFLRFVASPIVSAWIFVARPVLLNCIALNEPSMSTKIPERYTLGENIFETFYSIATFVYTNHMPIWRFSFKFARSLVIFCNTIELHPFTVQIYEQDASEVIFCTIMFCSIHLWLPWLSMRTSIALIVKSMHSGANRNIFANKMSADLIYIFLECILHLHRLCAIYTTSLTWTPTLTIFASHDSQLNTVF